ncbi:MAG: radical SAM protein [Candidatus Omnitrophota bacterium]
MKILLINPPRDNEVMCGSNPRIIEESRGFNPPLGLLYLAACLVKYTRHDVKVIDCQAEQLTYRQMEEYLSAQRPDIAGISAMTLTLIDVFRTAETVKRVNEGTKVVLGGAHVSLYPEETIKNKNVDYLLLGEGEYSFCGLVESSWDKQRLRDIPGLVFKDGEQIVKTRPAELIRDLDEIPFPGRRMVPYEKYDSLLTTRSPVTTMFTSRGCPFKCSFCARPHLGKKFRMQSAKKVLEEMRECVDMGIHEFLFYDDTFTVNKDRVMQLCDGILSSGIDVGWHIRSRVDTVDSEMLALLKRAGCKGIHYGVEAGTDKVLRVLEKGITVDQVKKTVALTKKHAIPTLAYFMVGNPGENRSDVMKTFELMKILSPDYAHITILAPFPGTKIYEDALSRGIIKTDVWRDFSAEPKNNFVPPVWEEHLSREELAELLITGYKRFYVNPRYVLKRIFKIRSLNELKKKLVSGARLLNLR